MGHIFGINEGNFITLKNDITGQEHKIFTAVGEPLDRHKIRRCREKLLSVSYHRGTNDDRVERAKESCGLLGEHGEQVHDGKRIMVTKRFYCDKPVVKIESWEITNSCRGCGEDFVVTEEQIKNTQEEYPEDKLDRVDAANIVDYCETCIYGEDE